MDIERLTKNKSKELGSEERIRITVEEFIQRNKTKSSDDAATIKKNVLHGNFFSRMNTLISHSVSIPLSFHSRNTLIILSKSYMSIREIVLTE